MKKILIAILMIMALVLSVSIVSATVTVESSFSESAPTFGDEDQMASNPKAEDDDKQDVYVNSGSITINNTGASAITIDGAEVTVYYENLDADDLNLSLVSSDTIASGANGNVILTARIPESLDAINDDLEEVALKVATVKLTANDSSTVSFDVYMQRKNMLDLSELEVEVDGDSDDYDGDGDRIDDIRPQDSIVVSIELENLYEDDDNEDIDIEDVDISVDLDNDFDVDEPSKNDLDPEEERTFVIEIDAEEDIDDSTYDMDMFIEAEDEFNAKHGMKLSLELEITRISKDILIKSLALREDELTCVRGENAVIVKLYNRGDKDQDEMLLTVKNSDLDLNFEEEDIEVKESKTVTKTISFTVPDSLAAGTYSIRISAYYDNDEDDLAELEDIDLVVKECAAATPIVVEPTTIEPEEIVVPAEVLEEFGITDTEESTSFTSSAWFVVLLTVLVMAALAGVVVLVVFLVKGSEEV